MLDLVSAVRFDRRASSGKSRPCLLACLGADRTEIELIAKMSAACERSIDALVAEAIAAMLATDLGLPIPEPFLVDMSTQFVQSITDREIAQIAQRSSSIAFGSRKLPPGFVAWPRDRRIPQALIQSAAEIFAFDAVIQNSDRRPENPNCLVKGAEIAIFDHDLAFPGRLVIGGKPAWLPGALQFMAKPDFHLLYSGLQGKRLDFSRFEGAWQLISDKRIEQYAGALPAQWLTNSKAPDMLESIHDIRANIQGCMAEVTRVLR